jgi:hypothetical protein
MSLATDLARSVDPAALCEVIGMQPDPWQVDVLRSRSERQLLNCCRQAGKSTTAAVLAVHTAVYSPASLVLLLSPSQRQSGELFKVCATIYRHLGRGQEGETRTSLELENGSRIVSLPGTESTIRGYAGVSLLIIDEASRVPDDLYASVRPMLAVSGGRLVAMSTPHGLRGWWADAWHNGGPGWERVRITGEQVPRISRSFLAEERSALGPWLFKQEYEGAFVNAEDSVFSDDDIAAMVAPIGGPDDERTTP